MLVADTVQRMAATSEPIEILGFLNDLEPAGHLFGNTPVVGSFEKWTELDDDVCFVAPLHKAGEMIDRLERIETLKVPTSRWHSVVDSTAIFFGGVELGAGCFIAAYSVTKSSVRIGHHVAIRDQASIGHDTILEEFAFVGTGARIGGYCHLERGAYIGTGAMIREHIRVGAFATVGMGAVVVDDVPNGATVVGNPARPIKASSRRDK